MRVWFVYILKCADDSYYIGYTGNLERRLRQHQSGKNPESYTASLRPVELLWSGDFQSPDDARAFERQLKGWTRKKKEALIRGDFEALKKLSKKKNFNR